MEYTAVNIAVAPQETSQYSLNKKSLLKKTNIAARWENSNNWHVYSTVKMWCQEWIICLITSQKCIQWYYTLHNGFNNLVFNILIFETFALPGSLLLNNAMNVISSQKSGLKKSVVTCSKSWNAPNPPPPALNAICRLNLLRELK